MLEGNHAKAAAPPAFVRNQETRSFMDAAENIAAGKITPKP
jgi:hypothetical protein